MTSLDASRFGAHERRTGATALVQTPAGSAKHIPVPDLRFEYSYLKSIAPYVKTRRVGDGDAREIISVEWKKVFWITARDQLISPLLQGCVWGVAQLFVRPLAANLRAFFGFGKRTSSANSSSEKPSRPKGDGELTIRLREWSKELKGGLEPNIILST